MSTVELFQNYPSKKIGNNKTDVGQNTANPNLQNISILRKNYQIVRSKMSIVLFVDGTITGGCSRQNKSDMLMREKAQGWDLRNDKGQ